MIGKLPRRYVGAMFRLEGRTVCEIRRRANQNNRHVGSTSQTDHAFEIAFEVSGNTSTPVIIAVVGGEAIFVVEKRIDIGTKLIPITGFRLCI